jgi:hypothetical protein
MGERRKRQWSSIPTLPALDFSNIPKDEDDHHIPNAAPCTPKKRFSRRSSILRAPAKPRVVDNDMTPIRIAAPKFIEGPVTPIRPTAPSPSLLRAPRKTIRARNVEDDDVEADMSFAPRPRLFPDVVQADVENDENDEEEVKVEMAVEVEEQVEVAPAPEVPVIDEREMELLAEKVQRRVEKEERRRIKERISWIMAVKENGDPSLLEEAKQLKESLRELRKLRRAVRATAEEKTIVVSASVLRV